MICLTVCNHKGGTGKTTTSMNLAAAMGLTGHRVLVVDLDPQGFLTRMMGQNEAAPEASSLALFDEKVQPADIQVTNLKTFDLVRSSAALSTAIRRLTKPTDVLWLREFRDAIQDKYDVLIIDTAAAITVFSLNALVAADVVLIPVSPEYQPIVGGEQTYQTAQLVRKRLNPDMKAARFLLTMVDGRKKNHLAYRQYLRERYEHRVMQSVIRTCTTLSLIRKDGLTVFETSPRARGSIDYAHAVDELNRLFATLIPADKGDSDVHNQPSDGKSEAGEDLIRSITAQSLKPENQTVSLSLESETSLSSAPSIAAEVTRTTSEDSAL